MCVCVCVDILCRSHCRNAFLLYTLYWWEWARCVTSSFSLYDSCMLCYVFSTTTFDRGKKRIHRKRSENKMGIMDGVHWTVFFCVSLLKGMKYNNNNNQRLPLLWYHKYKHNLKCTKTQRIVCRKKARVKEARIFWMRRNTDGSYNRKIKIH